MSTTPESTIVRLSLDVFIQRINPDGTEAPVVGPLPAEVLGVQAQADVVQVGDTRRGRRGKTVAVVADQKPTTGSLTLLACPPKTLALVAMGTETTVSQSATTITGEQHTYQADYGIRLASRNIGSVVVTPGTFATLATGAAGTNNGITWTAVHVGPDGNAVSVALLDPAANNAPLSITVSGSAISVHLATGVAGAITTTATALRAAIAANAAAAALVATAHTGASTGAATVAATASTHLATGSTAGTAYTLGTDYQVLDAREGLIRPLSTGTMGASGTCFVSYSVGTISGPAVQWGTDAIIRVRLWGAGTNDASPTGEEIRWEGDQIVLIPDGELDFASAKPLTPKFKFFPETQAGATSPATLSWPTYGIPA